MERALLVHFANTAYCHYREYTLLYIWVQPVQRAHTCRNTHTDPAQIMAPKLSAGCVLTAHYWESSNTHIVNLLHVEKASAGKNDDNNK